MDPTGESYEEHAEYADGIDVLYQQAEEEGDESEESSEPDPFEHWDNLYDKRRMSTDDMEAPGPGGRWSKFYTTYGGGPEGGLAYLYEHDDENVPLGLYEWSRTWFSLIRLRRRAGWRAVYAVPEPGVEKVRLVQLVEPFYELREEWEEQWFDEFVANFENEGEAAEQQEQEEQQEESGSNTDSSSEQSDFVWDIRLSKEAVEDTLETLLEERGVAHLTNRAWKEIKVGMRQWIDTTADAGIVDSVRDLLVFRWDELMQEPNDPEVVVEEDVEVVQVGNAAPVHPRDEVFYLPNETPGVSETSPAEPPSSAAPPIDGGDDNDEADDSNGEDHSEFLGVFVAP